MRYILAVLLSTSHNLIKSSWKKIKLSFNENKMLTYFEVKRRNYISKCYMNLWRSLLQVYLYRKVFLNLIYNLYYKTCLSKLLVTAFTPLSAQLIRSWNAEVTYIKIYKTMKVQAKLNYCRLVFKKWSKLAKLYFFNFRANFSKAHF